MQNARRTTCGKITLVRKITLDRPPTIPVSRPSLPPPVSPGHALYPSPHVAAVQMDSAHTGDPRENDGLETGIMGCGREMSVG